MPQLKFGQLILGQHCKCDCCQTAVAEDKVGPVMGCLDVTVKSRVCRAYASAAMHNAASLFRGRLELLLPAMRFDRWRLCYVTATTLLPLLLIKLAVCCRVCGAPSA
jgi:hypothetical protein